MVLFLDGGILRMWIHNVLSGSMNTSYAAQFSAEVALLFTHIIKGHNLGEEDHRISILPFPPIIPPTKAYPFVLCSFTL